MRVLFVSSEAYPFAKTGGLADVSHALPLALRAQGVDARLLLPGYPGALEKLVDSRVEMALDGILGVPDARLIAGLAPGSKLPVWLIDAPSLYDRPGGLYQDANGDPWPDNARRFAFLSHVAAQVGMGLVDGWTPDVVHANDWHAALAPQILSTIEGARPATVFTIHNMAFQGNFPAEVLQSIGVHETAFTSDGLEFYGQISFLKAGIRYSDRVTTVSPTYQGEVLTPEFGFGLEGLLGARADDFVGILNGAEYSIWDPAHDPELPCRYEAGDLSGKRQCKLQLQRELGLALKPDTPVIAFVSRLTRQKMADVVLDALPWLAGQDAQFILLSEGDRDLEERFRETGRHAVDKLAVRIGYEEPLAHRILAGADIVLTPARFEPCGLTQLYAMRYGALPIARKVGGLADTVTAIGSNCGASPTGFLFEGADASALTEAISQALAVYREPLAWRRLQRNAMARDFGWRASAAKYHSLYRSLVGADAEVVAPSEPCQTNEVALTAIAAQLADGPVVACKASKTAREADLRGARSVAMQQGGSRGYNDQSADTRRYDPHTEL